MIMRTRILTEKLAAHRHLFTDISIIRMSKFFFYFLGEFNLQWLPLDAVRKSSLCIGMGIGIGYVWLYIIDRCSIHKVCTFNIYDGSFRSIEINVVDLDRR